MNKEQVENYITELESMFELSELEEHSRNILKVGIYINKLQQENKILKENAENNDKVVDKVNWENMLLKKENQELKKQLEESDFKIANLTMDKIELKKQLEDLQETHYLIQGGRSNGKTYLMKLQADKEQLNSLVNSCQEEIRRLKKQLEEKENIACDWKDSCLENAGKIEILENQQKEFIKYLEDEIQQQETVIAENQEKSYFLIYEDKKEDLKLSSQKAYIRRIILEEILQKYKSIIGGKE